MDAFERPMTFSSATTKGNMTTSEWIAATGKIGPETPERFRVFLESEGRNFRQIVLHSPGGNLAAGLELGRMIRRAGLSTHIGQTARIFESYSANCDTWWDEVNSGMCASSCAYAFLGGRERFVNSPYYPTSSSLLGFHQFYGSPDRGAEMLSADEVAAIETSTLSVAQAITGQIVLYAIEMGVDPRIVALASSTPSDDLYYPTSAELDELSIASGEGLSAWFMEPYADGLVAAARPHRSDSMLEQVTAYCRAGSGEPRLLVTMSLQTPSYPNPDDLPLNALEVTINGQMSSLPRRDMDVRYGDGTILVTASMGGLKDRVLNAKEINFRLDAARVMGGFNEGGELDDAARQSIALAWRNCI
ncbi:hypothetical protein [Loktanella sp. 3ANDIMAR09]|uniref:COG3904 family protein n=1 Tax=Loktanella sp. 3ANDIMAR09 TaxID=1225657 RepID=UPI0012ED3BCC|nr:hypothetical protein [Loktanella sp. 3ANDIMAR09]